MTGFTSSRHIGLSFLEKFCFLKFCKVARPLENWELFGNGECSDFGNEEEELIPCCCSSCKTRAKTLLIFGRGFISKIWLQIWEYFWFNPPRTASHILHVDVEEKFLGMNMQFHKSKLECFGSSEVHSRSPSFEYNKYRQRYYLEIKMQYMFSIERFLIYFLEKRDPLSHSTSPQQFRWRWYLQRFP